MKFILLLFFCLLNPKVQAQEQHTFITNQNQDMVLIHNLKNPNPIFKYPVYVFDKEDMLGRPLLKIGEKGIVFEKEMYKWPEIIAKTAYKKNPRLLFVENLVHFQDDKIFVFFEAKVGDIFIFKKNKKRFYFRLNETNVY